MWSAYPPVPATVWTMCQLSLIHIYPDADVKIAALTDDASEVAIPFRKGDETASLREAVNQAISELRESGQLSELSEKYFGTDISQE